MNHNRKLVIPIETGIGHTLSPCAIFTLVSIERGIPQKPLILLGDNTVNDSLIEEREIEKNRRIRLTDAFQQMQQRRARLGRRRESL